MVKLLILADDFTGALDTAVQFSKNNIHTMVVLYRDISFEKPDPDVEVMVIDTESRHVSEAEAASRIKRISAEAARLGVMYFYKKADSALRGNVGSELSALMEGVHSERLMFMPAYPDAKRTTVNGVQYVDGIPVGQSYFARDPLEPVKFSYIPDVIKSQADIHVETVKSDKLHVGGQNGKTIYVFDAENNEDLRKTALLLKKKNLLRTTAGCAGFANTLLNVLELSRSERICESKVYNNMLVVCGSINEMSLRQAKFAEDHNFYCVTLNPQQKLDEDYFKTDNGIRLIERIIRMLNEKRNVIIKTVNHSTDGKECLNYAHSLHIDAGRVPFVITQNIAKLVKEIAVRKKLDTIVVFGGDTSVKIMEALELEGVLPLEEIMTGVVLSKTIGKNLNFNLITKSGGFGEENVLVKIHEYMSEQNSNSTVHSQLEE